MDAIKALFLKLQRLAYNTNNGKHGVSLVAENSLAKADAITTVEALALMRDGLRWRALTCDPGRPDIDGAALEHSADAVLAAL